METKLKPKEKLFCIYYCQYRNAELSAAMAGYPFPKKAGLRLIAKSGIKNEIEYLDDKFPVTKGEVISGYRQLAFGTGCDAFRLLFADEPPSIGELDEMNLLNISEIKRPKNGGIEIKFFDRLKALEKLEDISTASNSDSALPFYEVIERSASTLKDVENGS